MSIALPRYVVARQRGGRTVYYWQVPLKHRAQAGHEVWPDGVTRLPDDAAEMLAAAKRLNDELDQRREGAPLDRRAGSMPWLIAQYEQSLYFTGLSARTQRSYQQLSGYLLAWSKEKNHPPFKTLTTEKILEFLARFDDRRALRDHVATYLRIVLDFARRTGKGVEHNPARSLGLTRARKLKKLCIVDVDQVLAIVARADAMGLPWVATGALLHFDLGQRQGDVLRLQKPRDYRGGVFQFHQAKTDQIVTIKPFLAETRARLDALPLAQLMLVAGAGGGAVGVSTYTVDFRKVVRACGFANLWEMELRHSCVIFCERAGLTPAEIATRTGHSLNTVTTILESYRYRDPVVAHQGAVKLEDYRNKSSAKV